MNNTFLIIGANSFLGKSFINYLTSINKKVIAVSRHQVDKINNINVTYIDNIDLLIEERLEDLCIYIDKEVHEPFNLINCVGYFSGFNLLVEESISEIKNVIDSNITTTINLANKIIPKMIKRGGGHFINFSSHTVYEYFPKTIVFSSAKSALESISKGIANEYYQNGIISNCFALATILTETEKRLKPRGDHQNWLTTNEICEVVSDFMLNSSRTIISGNIIHLYKYSDTYFNETFFERIRLKS